MLRRPLNITNFLAKLKQLHEWYLIQTSGFFDEAWYLEHNPDVAHANLNPALHYLKFGSLEGRDPSPHFSTNGYLETYRDVKEAGINPVIHYVKYGHKEGRKITGSISAPLTTTQVNANQERSTFLSAYLSELGLNIFNHFSDNYDYYRFGEEEAQNNGVKNVYDATVLSGILVDAIKMVEPHLHRFEKVFQNLADDESKETLVKLLAYRALGYKKVKLSLNTPKYWAGIKEIENLSDPLNTITLPNTQWHLPLIDLHQKNIPITLYGVPFGIFTQYILQHYQCVTNDGYQIGADKGDFIIDAGGCWGDTALYFASRAGESGRVFSFEFVPANLDLFLKNLDLNPSLKPRIDIIKNAVWEQSDVKISFADNGPATRISSIIDNTGQVETLSIDDFVSSRQISHVDLIKMDIEGSELEALRGAVQTIRKYRPKLAISIYHKFSDYLDIPEFITSLNLGYQLYIRHFTIHAEETVIFAKV